MELEVQRHVAVAIEFPIVDADGDVVQSAANLDSEYSGWNGSTPSTSFTDCSNEATHIAGSGSYTLVLTQTETNFDRIHIQIKTTTSGAKTQHILLRTKIGDPKYDAVTQSGVNAATAASISALNDPTQTDISTSAWGYSTRVLTANTNLNDPTASAINAVITTAHGTGKYTSQTSENLIGSLNNISTTEVQSIVNAEGDEIQSLINALNDVSTSQIQSIVNAEIRDDLNDPSQTDIQVSVWGALPANVATQTDVNALNDPTPSEINAVITTAHGVGSYVGAGASQTVLNKLDQIQTDVNEIQTDVNNLNDPTASEINAVITTAHGSGSYVGGGASQTVINKLDAIQTDINASQGTGFVKDTHSLKNIQSGINALNDVSATQIQSIVNAEGNEVQSLINALNDVSISQIQSIVNAEGLEVQSLVNNLDADVQALNDVSVAQIQSVINAQTSALQSQLNQIQSNVNATNTRVVKIEAFHGGYLAIEWSYNSSDVNNKLEFWQYDSQTNLNTHDKTTGRLNRWRYDITNSTVNLPTLGKVGDWS